MIFLENIFKDEEDDEDIDIFIPPCVYKTYEEAFEGAEIVEKVFVDAKREFAMEIVEISDNNDILHVLNPQTDKYPNKQNVKKGKKKGKKTLC